MALPNPGMKIDIERTAMVIIDPQNDFLSPEGVTWGVIGESVTENNTVDNIEKLFQAARDIAAAWRRFQRNVSNTVKRNT